MTRVYSPAGRCQRCNAEVETVNVEAFELTGQVLCEDCADEVFLEAADDGSDWLRGAAVLAVVALVIRPLMMMGGVL